MFSSIFYHVSIAFMVSVVLAVAAKPIVSTMSLVLEAATVCMVLKKKMMRMPFSGLSIRCVWCLR